VFLPKGEAGSQQASLLELSIWVFIPKQGAKDLYNKNYKSLNKETEDIRRQKGLPCQKIGKINIVKMAVLPKAIYMFKCNPH
jgi:hypothetical protein